jgi:hypothetical protein
MAGLLDIFGTSGAETMGLLGMSPEDVARSREEAQAQALFALAGRLFKGGSGGASIVEGLQQGQQAYKTAMQGGLQQQLQNAQLQDMLRKRQQEQAALAETQRIQNVIKGGVTQPQEIYGEDIMGQRVGEGMTAPSFDLQRVMPQLMTSPEGRKALKDLQPEYKEVNGILYEITAGMPPKVVAGTTKRDTVTVGNKLLDKNTLDVLYTAPEVPKVAKLTGKESNAALLLYGTDDVAKLREIPNAIDKIRAEATNQRKAEQPQINLSDPTAVAKAQLATVNQWQGTLKDTGDTTVASRAAAFYDAFNQAGKGNASADGAMIYNLAKVYDQTGAVQKGDVETIIGNPSIPQRIQLLAQQLVKGGTFTPQQRLDAKSIIEGIVSEREKALEPTLNVYRNLNKEMGGKPEAIINPYDAIKKSNAPSSGLPSGVTVKRKPS